MSAGLRDLSILLQLRVRLLLRRGLRSYTRSARLAAPIRLVVTVLILIWLVGTIVFPLSTFLVASLGGTRGRLFLTPFLSTGLSGVSALIFFYALITLGMTITARSDLDLLLLTPVSPLVIMAEKILSVSLGFSALLLLGFPAVIGIDRALHLGPVFEVTAIVTVLLVPITPVCLAMLLVLAILRWFPAASARTMLTVLGTALGAAAFIGTQLLLAPSHAAGASGTLPSLPGAVPTSWPGHALASAGLGRPLTAFTYFLGSIVLALATFGLSASLASRTLATGLGTYKEVARRKRDRLPRARPIRASLPSISTGATFSGVATVRSARRAAWEALFSKEWLTFRRDPQRIAQFAYPLLIVGFYAYRSIAAGTSATSDPGQNSAVSGGTLYAVLTFTAILLISSIAPTIINGEGSSLYLLALAPISARSILIAKWLICVAPVTVLVEVILVIAALALGLGIGHVILAGLMLAMLVSTLTGLTLVFNLIWPRLNSGSGRRQASLTASLVGMVSELVVGSILVALLLVAFALWPQLPWAAVAAYFAMVLLGGILIFGATIVGSRLLSALLIRDRGLS